MAAQQPWQPNYHDLGDDRTIHFAGECAICGARYATAQIRRPSGKDADALTDEDFVRAKRTALTLFDAAFRELGIVCPRCGRLGCPECWDGDHQLCGACVAALGRGRSPHQGLLMRGPLADGRLERIEPGRYSDPEVPTWVTSLMKTRPALDPALPGFQDPGGGFALEAAMSAATLPRPMSPGASQHSASFPAMPNKNVPATSPPPFAALPSPAPLSFAASAPALPSAASGIVPFSPSFAGSSAVLRMPAPPADTWSQSSQIAAPQGTAQQVRRSLGGVGRQLARSVGTLLVAIGLVALILMIAAALSPDVNALLVRFVHLDVRALLSQFGQMVIQWLSPFWRFPG